MSRADRNSVIMPYQIAIFAFAAIWNCKSAHAVPLPAPSNLVVWLDGQDINGNGTNPLVGTQVMQWTDKSGNGFHAVQPTVAQRPLYSAAQINTHAALLFDGIDDLSPIKRATVSSSITQFTSFFVWNLVSQNYGVADHPVMFANGVVNAGGRYTGLEIGLNAGASANTLDFFGGFGDDERATQTNIAGTGYSRMLSWNSTSTHNTLVWQNGNSVTTSNTGANDPWNFVIGGGAVGDNFGVGGYEWPSLPLLPAYINEAVGEVILYNSVLSTSDRQLVEGILAWKWGLQGQLPTDHPFFNINPNLGVPEPSSMLLTSLGVAGLAIRTRQRRHLRF